MIFVVYHNKPNAYKILVGTFLLKADALEFMGLSGNGNLELKEVHGQWGNWEKIREAI